MTSLQRPLPVYYMDYPQNDAGALDLSRRRSSGESIESNASYAAYDNLMHQFGPSTSSVDEAHYARYENSPSLSPEIKYERPRNEQIAVAYFQAIEKKQTIDKSPSTPSQSPPGSYPGTEHLSQYVIQAELQQTMTTNNPETPKPAENDAVSETNSESSRNSTFSMYPAASKDGKMPRPFKAYPKDPLSLTTGFSAVDSSAGKSSAERYAAFRNTMLNQICASNGGTPTVSNPKMRRTVNNNNNDDANRGNEARDTSYTERRRKNNAAAKKSRDRRRMKEDEIAIRASFLERENIELRYELAAARKQMITHGIPFVTPY